MINFIIGALFLLALTLGIVAAFGVFNSNKNDGTLKSIPPQSEPKQKTPPFITPTAFGTGYLKDSPQMPADNCREYGSALYPIQQPYVDYGEWKGGDRYSGTCDVAKFNSPP